MENTVVHKGLWQAGLKCLKFKKIKSKHGRNAPYGTGPSTIFRTYGADRMNRIFGFIIGNVDAECTAPLSQLHALLLITF